MWLPKIFRTVERPTGTRSAAAPGDTITIPGQREPLKVISVAVGPDGERDLLVTYADPIANIRRLGAVLHIADGSDITVVRAGHRGD